MRMKWLSLILAIMLLPSICLFSACNNDPGYNLNNMSIEYEKMADNLEFVDIVEGKIKFSYNNTALLSVMATDPYTRLNEFYIPLLDNSMTFAYVYAKSLSRDELGASKSLRNNIKHDLDSMQETLEKVNYSLRALNDAVAFSFEAGDSVTSLNCMIKLSDVYYYFEALLGHTVSFNENLMDLYYRYALNINSNPDFYNMSLEQLDTLDSIIYIKSRQRCQVVNQTRLFLEKCVEGATLYSMFTDDDGFKPVPNEYGVYTTQITSISENIDNNRAEAINNDIELKKTFKNLIVEMQNIQNVLNNDKPKYFKAIEEISYYTTSKNVNATVKEKNCMTLIDDYEYILGEYNQTLTKLIKFIKEV